MRPLSLVIINGSPNARSKTGSLAGLIANTLAEMVPLTVRQVNVHELGPGFTEVSRREDTSPLVEAELRAIEGADLLIAATPVYRGSYSGMFKHLFDLVDQYALANKTVILAATGGSDRHALVIEHALRPLLGFFQAAVAPVGYYVSASDFDGTTILNSEVYSRIQIGLSDIVPQLELLANTEVSPASLLTES